MTQDKSNWTAFNVRICVLDQLVRNIKQQIITNIGVTTVPSFWQQLASLMWWPNLPKQRDGARARGLWTVAGRLVTDPKCFLPTECRSNTRDKFCLWFPFSASRTAEHWITGWADELERSGRSLVLVHEHTLLIGTWNYIGRLTAYRESFGQ